MNIVPDLVTKQLQFAVQRNQKISLSLLQQFLQRYEELEKRARKSSGPDIDTQCNAFVDLAKTFDLAALIDVDTFDPSTTDLFQLLPSKTISDILFSNANKLIKDENKKSKRKKKKKNVNKEKDITSSFQLTSDLNSADTARDSSPAVVVLSKSTEAEVVADTENTDTGMPSMNPSHFVPSKSPTTEASTSDASGLLSQVLEEMKKEFQDVRKDLQKDINHIGTGMKKELQDVRKDINDVRKDISEVRTQMNSGLTNLAEIMGLTFEYAFGPHLKNKLLALGAVIKTDTPPKQVFLTRDQYPDAFRAMENTLNASKYNSLRMQCSNTGQLQPSCDSVEFNLLTAEAGELVLFECTIQNIKTFSFLIDENRSTQQNLMAKMLQLERQLCLAENIHQPSHVTVGLVAPCFRTVSPAVIKKFISKMFEIWGKALPTLSKRQSQFFILT